MGGRNQASLEGSEQIWGACRGRKYLYDHRGLGRCAIRQVGLRVVGPIAIRFGEPLHYVESVESPAYHLGHRFYSLSVFFGEPRNFGHAAGLQPRWSRACRTTPY